MSTPSRRPSARLRLCCTVVAGALSVLGLPAQSESATTGPARAIAGFDWRVPIHGAGAEHWAAGPGYRVRFARGPHFYPVLAPDAPAETPVQWRTTSVRLGDVDLLSAGEPVDVWHDDWRLEYRSRLVAERYDVRAEGVEQSFVVAQPPRGRGDLVITGQWRSALTPVRDAVPARAPAALRFVDRSGLEVVRYGRAIAIDAGGRRIDVATVLDGDSIRLVVPAAWLERARWPVTVDPLLSPQVLSSPVALAALVEHTDVVVSPGPAVHRVLVAFSVRTSAGDRDVYVLLTDRDLANPVLVFADVSALARTGRPRAAFVKGGGTTGRWAIAYEHDRPALQPNAQVRVWLHDGGDTTFGSGSSMVLPVTVSGRDDRRPDIGGSFNDQYALLVYESDAGTLGTVLDETELYRVLLDANAKTFGAPQLLDATPVAPVSAQVDRGNPSVSPNSSGAPLSWMVCYQQRAFLPAGWSIRARLIFNDGSARPSALIVPTGGAQASKIEPSVDGGNTRYGVAYLQSGANTATRGAGLSMTRFMWAPQSLLPTVQWSAPVATGPTVVETLDEPRAVYDSNAAHWAVAWRRRSSLLGRSDSIGAARVGFDGAVVETQTVSSASSSDAAAPAIAFDFATTRFLLTYTPNQTTSPVMGRLWTYPTAAVNVPYGVGCGGGFGRVSTPLVGTEFFRVRLTAASANAPAALLVSAGAAGFPLAFAGAPGCTLLVDPGVMVALPATTDSMGDALVTLIHLTVAGDIHLQWAHAAPAANPLGLLLTDGLRCQLR